MPCWDRATGPGLELGSPRGGRLVLLPEVLWELGGPTFSVSSTGLSRAPGGRLLSPHTVGDNSEVSTARRADAQSNWFCHLLPRAS